MSEWQPIATAPKDGACFVGRRSDPDEWNIKRRYTRRVTWFGKTSHVPLYGWCHGRVEDVDLWEPTHWKPIH